MEMPDNLMIYIPGRTEGGGVTFQHAAENSKPFKRCKLFLEFFFPLYIFGPQLSAGNCS